MLSAMVRVADIQEATAGCFYLLLENETLAGEALPGQFLHLRIAARSLTPFLRRPFSIAGALPGKGLLQVLFRVVGEGTELLSKVERGDELECLGPLGNGFELGDRFEDAPDSAGAPASAPASVDKSGGDKTHLSILLGGGIGIAPLLFLANRLHENNRKVILFYGAPRAAELIPVERFLPPGVEVNLATDDGSGGYKGFITDMFQAYLHKQRNQQQSNQQQTTRQQDGAPPLIEVFACGPRQMLQTLAGMEAVRDIEMQFSLEERMACGVGACCGCAVEIRSAEAVHETIFKRVCRDGPVFKSSEVVW